MRADGEDAAGQGLRLLGVYDADGGLAGELRYVVGHLLGTASCSLCDITHSPVRRKPEWDRMVASLGVPLEVVHRNELPDWARSAVATVKLPAVVARTSAGSVVEVLGRADLDACDGSVRAFRARLTEALGALG